ASDTSTTTVSLNSKSSIQALVVSVSPKELPTVTLVQAANDEVKSHPSVRNSVKVTNLSQSIESSIPPRSSL
ncbi:unnamed protein product, partial [Hymenolepis diminuta]